MTKRRTTSVPRYPKAESTGNEEWHTRKKYINLAREVFGGKIDVDPASSDLAQQTVQATTYFTKDNDGLKQEWHGHTRLNPPTGRGLSISSWISWSRSLRAGTSPRPSF
jgi:hypothetical protein